MDTSWPNEDNLANYKILSLSQIGKVGSYKIVNYLMQLHCLLNFYPSKWVKNKQMASIFAKQGWYFKIIEKLNETYLG